MKNLGLPYGYMNYILAQEGCTISTLEIFTYYNYFLKRHIVEKIITVLLSVNQYVGLFPPFGWWDIKTH